MSLRARLGRAIRAMKLRARPSKSYLHRLFDADLAAVSDVNRTADIASADFKNVHLFESDIYYAVDVDEEGLQAGLSSVKDATTEFVEGPVDEETMARHDGTEGDVRVAVLGDMRDALFPGDSLDLIASTHTFSHVPPADHTTVLDNFCTALRPGGTLLLQLGEVEWYEGELEQQLTDAFETVETHRYRTPVSATYERLVADDEGAVVFPHDDNQIKHYLMILASAALLQFEKPGLLGGSSVYIRCIGRR